MLLRNILKRNCLPCNTRGVQIANHRNLRGFAQESARFHAVEWASTALAKSFSVGLQGESTPGTNGAKRGKPMLSSKRLGLLLVVISVIMMALTAFVIYLSTTPR